VKYSFFGSETFRIHAFDAGRRRGFTCLSFEDGAVDGFVGIFCMFISMSSLSKSRCLLRCTLLSLTSWFKPLPRRSKKLVLPASPPGTCPTALEQRNRAKLAVYSTCLSGGQPSS
jgi:hypothetical protein